MLQQIDDALGKLTSPVNILGKKKNVNVTVIPSRMQFSSPTRRRSWGIPPSSSTDYDFLRRLSELQAAHLSVVCVWIQTVAAPHASRSDSSLEFQACFASWDWESNARPHPRAHTSFHNRAPAKRPSVRITPGRTPALL